MKRILIISNHFYPFKGGLENFVLDLGKILSKKGYIIDVLTYKEQSLPLEETYEKINIYRLPCITIIKNVYEIPKFNSDYKKIMKKILAKKYDSIITNTRFFTITYLGMRIAKKTKTKFIHIEHGNRTPIYKNPLITALAWMWDQTLGRKIFKTADVVVAISSKGIKFAERLGAKNTLLIHNSIDTKSFKPKKNDLRKKLGIQNNNLVIMNGIGRLIYAKGLQDTFKASKGENNITIITVGEGPYETTLKKIAKENNVNSVFVGKLNKEQIIEYLSITDIMINPSYSEGLPTCVLEAGAMGVPVIATDVGGTNEIITNKKEGILVRPNDPESIKKALHKLRTKITRKQMGLALQKKVINNFDWEKNIDKLRKIL